MTMDYEQNVISKRNKKYIETRVFTVTGLCMYK